MVRVSCRYQTESSLCRVPYPYLRHQLCDGGLRAWVGTRRLGFEDEMCSGRGVSQGGGPSVLMTMDMRRLHLFRFMAKTSWDKALTAMMMVTGMDVFEARVDVFRGLSHVGCKTGEYVFVDAMTLGPVYSWPSRLALVLSLVVYIHVGCMSEGRLTSEACSRKG